MNFEGTDVTVGFFGDYLWKSRYIEPQPENIAMAVVFGITIPLPILVIVLLFVFRNNRRVYSRGVVPYIGLMYVISSIISNVILYAGRFIALPHFSISIVVNDVLLVCTCLGMVIQTTRFYLFSYLYANMSKNLPNHRIVSFLSHHMLSISCVLILGIIWTSFGIIMVVLSYYYVITIYVFVYVTIALSAALGLISIIGALFDICFNLVRTRCDVLGVLSRSDPLQFRTDSLLLMPIIAFGVIGNIIYLIQGNDIVYIIFFEFFYLLLILYFGGLVVTHCVVDFVRNYHSTHVVLVDEGGPSENLNLDNSDDIIKRMFSNNTSLEYIKQFCLAEFSLENAISFSELQEMINDPSSITKDSFTSFHHRFVRPNSEMELNLNANLVRDCNEAVRGDVSEGELGVLVQRLFDSVVGNLQDTFSRFKLTREYKLSIEAVRRVEIIKRQAGE
ncbi:hypothetical protein AKO1_011555 [Acrasis kona]|uniref:RGS domain-containing protein n=1 Tax=Acrasis kona TaxID=1008807 RepID=A0AAW2Z1S5_9EUKA